MDTNRMATAACALGMLAYIGMTSLLSSADALEADGEYTPERIELIGTSDPGSTADDADAISSREAEPPDGSVVVRDI